MKHTFYLLIGTIILASCGGGKETKTAAEQLDSLKKVRSAIDEKILALEADNKDTTKKATPVSIAEMKPTEFNAYVEVQGQVSGDQNVNATPQAPGVVKKINVRVGQKVSKGQTLALLDAAVVEQQIKAIESQWTLQKSLYEKQQKLWEQNIGTEVQLMSSKAQFEALSKQKAALVAQRDMYTIKSPINGTVDAVNVKEGEAATPGFNGIHVVNGSKLKVQASLGENYLGKVKQGDHVQLIFTDINDTIQTKLAYVGQAVDPISRAFQVEVGLEGNNKLHPNMSCKMQISNYRKSNAFVVPVSVIQHTAQGDMLYLVVNGKAKATFIEAGRNSNGQVEIVSGLKTGDKVIIQGSDNVDEGAKVEQQ